MTNITNIDLDMVDGENDALAQEVERVLSLRGSQLSRVVEERDTALARVAELEAQLGQQQPPAPSAVHYFDLHMARRLSACEAGVRNFKDFLRRFEIVDGRFLITAENLRRYRQHYTFDDWKWVVRRLTSIATFEGGLPNSLRIELESLVCHVSMDSHGYMERFVRAYDELAPFARAALARRRSRR